MGFFIPDGNGSQRRSWVLEESGPWRSTSGDARNERDVCGAGKLHVQ
jgi:hypothetical protein